MEDKKLWSLRRQGNSYPQIARITGLSEEEVRIKMRVRRADGPADPNELMIQLVTSAIRLHWSDEEQANRRSMGRYTNERHDPTASRPRPSRN